MNAKPSVKPERVVCPTCGGRGKVWSQRDEGPMDMEKFWEELNHPDYSNFSPHRTTSISASCPTCEGEKYIDAEA